MAKRVCKNCKAYHSSGTCRANPPEGYFRNDELVAFWPFIEQPKTDWCEAFKPRVAKATKPEVEPEDNDVVEFDVAETVVSQFDIKVDPGAEETPAPGMEQRIELNVEQAKPEPEAEDRPEPVEPVKPELKPEPEQPPEPEPEQ